MHLLFYGYCNALSAATKLRRPTLCAFVGVQRRPRVYILNFIIWLTILIFVHPELAMQPSYSTVYKFYIIVGVNYSPLSGGLHGHLSTCHLSPCLIPRLTPFLTPSPWLISCLTSCLIRSLPVSLPDWLSAPPDWLIAGLLSVWLLIWPPAFLSQRALNWNADFLNSWHHPFDRDPPRYIIEVLLLLLSLCIQCSGATNILNMGGGCKYLQTCSS